MRFCQIKKECQKRVRVFFPCLCMVMDDRQNNQYRFMLIVCSELFRSFYLGMKKLKNYFSKIGSVVYTEAEFSGTEQKHMFNTLLLAEFLIL